MTPVHTPSPLTAAICTFNRAKRLEAAILSLREQTLGLDLGADPGPDLPILVIDNGSTDETPRLVRELARSMPHLRYILEREPGLSRARNRALVECRTEIIAYIDDDAIADANWARAIVACFRELSPRVAAVGGRIKPQWEVPKPDWLDHTLEGYFSALDLGPGSIVLKEPRIFGANMAFKVAEVRAAGGFPIKLGRKGQSLLGNEELAVCFALRQRGLALAYCGGAIVEHFVPKERLSEQWLVSRVYSQGVSDAVLYTRVLPSTKAAAQVFIDALTGLAVEAGGAASPIGGRLKRAYVRGLLRGGLFGT